MDRQLLLWFNGSDSAFLDQWMATLTSGLTWIPLYIALLYLVIKNNETMSQIFLVIGCAVCCVLLSDLVADFIVKPLVGRYRPCYDPLIKYTIKVVDGIHGGDYGFFSAHASNTFSIALFMCLLVKNKTLGISLVLWSLLNCYTRLYLGMHYPTDIICGLIWGSVVACLSYYVYCRIDKCLSQKNNFVSSQYTSTGYCLDDIDIVELTLIAIVAITILMALCKC